MKNLTWETIEDSNDGTLAILLEGEIEEVSGGSEPRIRKIKYRPDGSIRKIKYFRD